MDEGKSKLARYYHGHGLRQIDIPYNKNKKRIRFRKVERAERYSACVLEQKVWNQNWIPRDRAYLHQTREGTHKTQKAVNQQQLSCFSAMLHETKRWSLDVCKTSSACSEILVMLWDICRVTCGYNQSFWNNSWLTHKCSVWSEKHAEHQSYKTNECFWGIYFCGGQPTWAPACPISETHGSWAPKRDDATVGYTIQFGSTTCWCLSSRSFSQSSSTCRWSVFSKLLVLGVDGPWTCALSKLRLISHQFSLPITPSLYDLIKRRLLSILVRTSCFCIDFWTSVFYHYFV
jgi:hypothetical protein